MLISLLLSNMSTAIIAANSEIFEVANGVYSFAAKTRSTNKVGCDNTLVNYENKLYIHLFDGYYAEAIEKEIDVENYREDISSLKLETQQTFQSVLSNIDDNSTITKLSVVTLAEENEVHKSLENMRSSNYPVTNEQVRYTRISSEKVIKSGNGTTPFEEYATELFKNVAIAFCEDVISLNPTANAIYRVASLFPIEYNNIKSYADYSLGLVLKEEKVVQLSWVNVLGDIYLGAHTQFTTVSFDSTFRTLARSYLDSTGFIYYKTPNYQSPQSVARANWGNTWIERIESYKFQGVSFPSLS